MNRVFRNTLIPGLVAFLLGNNALAARVEVSDPSAEQAFLEAALSYATSPGAVSVADAISGFVGLEQDENLLITDIAKVEINSPTVKPLYVFRALVIGSGDLSPTYIDFSFQQSSGAISLVSLCFKGFTLGLERVSAWATSDILAALNAVWLAEQGLSEKAIAEQIASISAYGVEAQIPDFLEVGQDSYCGK